MGAIGFNVESWTTVKADLDSVNISEEMSKTAMWKSIMSNESSTNLALQDKEREASRNSKK